MRSFPLPGLGSPSLIGPAAFLLRHSVLPAVPHLPLNKGPLSSLGLSCCGDGGASHRVGNGGQWAELKSPA